MKIQTRISQNSKLISLYSNRFIFEYFHVKQRAWWHKSTESESHQNVLLFLLLHFVFKRLVQNCVTLSLHIKQQNFTLSNAPALRFFTTLKPHKALEPVTKELWLHLQHYFLHLYSCTQITLQ